MLWWLIPLCLLVGVAAGVYAGMLVAVARMPATLSALSDDALQTISDRVIELRRSEGAR